MRAIHLAKMAELLTFHQTIDSPDELTEDNFVDIIANFQEKEGLFSDGIAGKDTLWKLQKKNILSQPKLKWEECKTDTFPGQLQRDVIPMVLRQDAAVLFNKIRAEVNAKGGIVTSAGGKRSLKARVSASRSSKSMHYAGLAFDLALTSGFFNPDKDPFVIVKTKSENPSTPYWTVFARVVEGEEMELEAFHWKSWNSKKDLNKTVRGKFLNFTAICKKHGFEPIGPRRGFLRSFNRNYLSAEWWHFQANSLLIPNLSQFGIELLRIEGYDQDRIKRNGQIWGNRKAIYRHNWF